jgi:creatinine amidohydrolase
MAVQQLGLEGYFVVAPTLWDITKEVIGDVMKTGFMHAEESETSLGLYLIPELVNKSKIHDEHPEEIIDTKKWVAGPGTMIKRHIPWYATTFAYPEYKHLKYGVIGTPTLATKEKGRKLVEAAVDWLVEFIEEVQKKYPAGVKPPVK